MTDIQPGVWYTHAEIAKLRDLPELGDFVMRGYVLQHEPSTGRMRFVHHTRAAMDAGTPGNDWGKPVEAVFDKNELPPIKPRTGAQRVDSLMEKVGEDLAHLIAGKQGKIPDGESVRRVAQSMLEDADVEHRKLEDKRITRTTGAPQA